MTTTSSIAMISQPSLDPVSVNHADEIEEVLARYLEEEREIYRTIDPRRIQLAGSRSFSSNGFPSACLTKHNLGYYLDSQQENRAEWYIRSIGKVDNLTAAIVRSALIILRQANSTTMGVGGGVSALVHGLYCALNIRNNLPTPKPDRPVHTLEIGPGSGWTTYFLTRFGFYTTTIDSNPNLIATQSFLMKHLPPECAGNYTQLPWWKFYDLNAEVPHAYDMVIANHMICEISQWSRLYIAKWAFVNLKETGRVFFQAWGNEDFHKRAEALADFDAHGLILTAQNKKNIFPEINVLEKRADVAEKLSYSFFARAGRRACRLLAAYGLILYEKRWPCSKLENYNLSQGVLVEELIRDAGFTKKAYYNPSFVWCKICH